MSPIRVWDTNTSYLSLDHFCWAEAVKHWKINAQLLLFNLTKEYMWRNRVPLNRSQSTIDVSSLSPQCLLHPLGFWQPQNEIVPKQLHDQGAVFVWLFIQCIQFSHCLITHHFCQTASLFRRVQNLIGKDWEIQCGTKCKLHFFLLISHGLLIVSRCHLRKISKRIPFHFQAEHRTFWLCSIGNKIFVRQLEDIVADVLQSCLNLLIVLFAHLLLLLLHLFSAECWMWHSSDKQISPFIGELVPCSMTAFKAAKRPSQHSACSWAWLSVPAYFYPWSLLREDCGEAMTLPRNQPRWMFPSQAHSSGNREWQPLPWLLNRWQHWQQFYLLSAVFFFYYILSYKTFRWHQSQICMMKSIQIIYLILSSSSPVPSLPHKW